MPESNGPDLKLSQLRKFNEVARQLACDGDEAAFEEKPKKIATLELTKGETHEG